jgi:hypothetical protein
MKSTILLVAVLLNYLPAKAQIQNDNIHNDASTNTNKSTMKFEIPGSLKVEHQELHEKLAQYTKLPGKTGAEAKEVARLLHPHFIKEEAYALPPLGLLSDLAKGKSISDERGAISMSEKLKNDFKEMLSEHAQIVKALQKLYQAANDEHHPEVMRFTENLKQHAKTEEEVLYPAAILVGEYLKLKSSSFHAQTICLQNKSIT